MSRLHDRLAIRDFQGELKVDNTFRAVRTHFRNIHEHDGKSEEGEFPIVTAKSSYFLVGYVISPGRESRLVLMRAFSGRAFGTLLPRLNQIAHKGSFSWVLQKPVKHPSNSCCQAGVRWYRILWCSGTRSRTRVDIRQLRGDVYPDFTGQ